jgi:hypothetical protein
MNFDKRALARTVLGVIGLAMFAFPFVMFFQLYSILPLLNEISVELVVGSSDPIVLRGGDFLLGMLFYLPVKNWILVEGWRLLSRQGLSWLAGVLKRNTGLYSYFKRCENYL